MKSLTKLPDPATALYGTFVIRKNSARYPGIARELPDKIIVYGTLFQAEEVAERISNWYAGCDFIFYVEEERVNMIKPLADRVIVIPEKSEEKTKSGIIIPEMAKEKAVIGKVIAVGPGRFTDTGTLLPVNVPEGGRVIYSKYAGHAVAGLNDEDLLILREEEILGILVDDSSSRDYSLWKATDNPSVSAIQTLGTVLEGVQVFRPKPEV